MMYRKLLRRAEADRIRALQLAAEAMRLMTDDQLVQLRDSLRGGRNHERDR
jgi:hypothetical protein